MNRLCSVTDCTRPSHARTFCVVHYARWRRTGDPVGLLPSGRPLVGEVPGYAAAHRRITRSMGPASAYTCVDCDGPALEWAYNGGDPDELVAGALSGEPPGLRYSLHMEFYSPRCVPCHRAMDGSTRRPRVRNALGQFAPDVEAAS